MSKLGALSLVLSVLACCGDHHAPAPATATTANTAQPADTAACKAQADDLRTYLTQVFDPAAKPAPPWPTGNADLDAQLDAARAKARTDVKTSAEKATPLKAHLDRGPLDDTLDKCPAAADAVHHIADFPEPDHMTKAANAIADGVAGCGCNVNIPLIKAGLYLLARGPD